MSLLEISKESKNCNLSSLKITEDMKLSVQNIDHGLSEFIISQDKKDKKFSILIMIMIAGIAIMCGLFVFSIIK